MANKKLEEIITQEGIELIVNSYKNNISLREIQRKYGYSRHSVAKMLERLGVKTTRGNHYRTYFHDFDYFEKIDSRDKAYWLGWMLSDGYVTTRQEHGEAKLGLSIIESDYKVLESFKKYIKATNPVKYYPNYDDVGDKFYSESGTCRLLLTSQKTVNDLMNKGVTVEKSINKQFPNKSQLPDNFLYDFLRGYFEGNGSITVYKNVTKENTCSLSFATTEDFAKGFSERVEKEFSITRYNDGRKGINIVIRTEKSAEITFKMYNDAPKDQILERKYQKYLEYIHNIK